MREPTQKAIWPGIWSRKALPMEEQNILVPKELGDAFLEKLIAWKRRQLAQLEEKANNIQVFDPTTIYQG